MLPKSIVVSAIALCGFALQSPLTSQQFRSGQLITIAPPSSQLFGSPYGIADVNGDGRPDILTSATDSTGTGIVAVLVQNSNGTFTEKTTSVPAGTNAIADLNGDGKADIVTILPAPTNDHNDPLGPATMVIAYGNGDATFRVQAPVNLTDGILQPWVMVEDLNHDGKPDIIATSVDQYGDAFVQTFLNNGNSTFRAGPLYNESVVGGQLLGVGDFNGDGFGDVAIKNNFQTQILLGNGDGSFTPGATYNVNAYAAGVGDLNKDHHLDLALISILNSVVMLGKGDGTFTTSATLDTAYGTATSPVQFSNPITPTQVYVGDLNKDGIPDLAIFSVSSTGTVSVYYGKGNRTFDNPKPFNIGSVYGGSSTPIAFGDLNRDGYLDVVKSNGQFAITWGTNDGGFNAPVTAQARYASSITKGDFNGDGIEDLAVVAEPVCSSCTGTSVRVFLGTGRGYFSGPRIYTIPVKWGEIAAGDVNRDGKMDLVVTRNAYLMNTVSGRPYTTPDVSVLLGRGDGTFDAPASYTLVGAPAPGTWADSAYLVDVNHDGKLDLVGDWGAALGNGAGQFAKPIALPSGIGTIVALAPGDFRASGTVDLAVASLTYSPSSGWNTPAYVYTLSGNGNGSFTVSHQQSIPGFLYNLTSADLNGDGLDDILYTYTTSDATGIYINLGTDLSQGQGAFTTATYTYPSFGFPASTDIVTGDFNRDGKMDVAFFGLLTDRADISVLFGAGGGVLNKDPHAYQGAIGKGVVLDVNGDGAPDIAGTTTIGISRMLNTGHK